MNKREWLECPECEKSDAISIQVGYDGDVALICHRCGVKTDKNFDMQWSMHDVNVFKGKSDRIEGSTYPWDYE